MLGLLMGLLAVVVKVLVPVVTLADHLLLAAQTLLTAKRLPGPLLPIRSQLTSRSRSLLALKSL